MASVAVDGSAVWSLMFAGDPSLYWTGAGNATVGDQMDGNASGITILDNLIIQQTPPITLPVTLTSFNAVRNGAHVQLDWTAAEKYAPSAGNGRLSYAVYNIDGKMVQGGDATLCAGRSATAKVLRN